jgi:hypothetical protein
MIYLRVRWKHSLPDEPILLFSELDDARNEVRKVEVFADGRRGFSSAVEAFGGSRMSDEPIPSLAEIGLDPEFEPVEISAEEFEQFWTTRMT